MHILALETSTKNFSLAIADNDKVLRFRNVRTDRILESSMTRSIEKLLSSCDLSFDDVDVLAVGLGPGSFTSLRVGLSTVKALALAADKKVVGISSLDLIAQGIKEKNIDEICVIADARRSKVYAAIYDAKTYKRKTEYLLTSIEDVLDRLQGITLFTGDALSLYQDTIEAAYKIYHQKNSNSTGCQAQFSSQKFWFPQSQELVKLANQRIEQKKFDDPAAIVPIYLYPQDCQVTKK